MSTAHAFTETNNAEHAGIEAIGEEINILMTCPTVDRKGIVGKLNLLKSTILNHFAYEESVMTKHKYPNFFHHRRSHNYIINELAVFINSFSTGRSDGALEIWPHLQQTLATHMVRYDEDLNHFMRRFAA